MRTPEIPHACGELRCEPPPQELLRTVELPPRDESTPETPNKRRELGRISPTSGHVKVPGGCGAGPNANVSAGADMAFLCIECDLP
jgi:hypothetical protein